MKTIFSFIMATFLLLLPNLELSAQWYKAVVLPDRSVSAVAVPAPDPVLLQTRGEGLSQMEGFPKAFAANPTFKNFRNVTLAHLDDRAGIEILFGADDTLYAYGFDSLLWSKPVEGVVIYPPTADGEDGDLFIQATGANGRLYAFDRRGTDLPGWPLNFNGHWIAAAPTLADIDADGAPEIVANELVGSSGFVHLLQLDGSEWGEAWPVQLDARPSVTPSVGDVDDDGQMDIAVHSTESRYVLGLDGMPLSGWPILTHPYQRYSYQSPILANLGSGGLSVIGATHGDSNFPDPYFFVDNPDGTPREGWPVSVPEKDWTFSTPTVLPTAEGAAIFFGRPIDTEADAMLFGFDQDGNSLPGFPIVKPGGLEGVISVADIDGDGKMELVFGSNIVDPEGSGFIHAYEMDGSGEVAGFPLRTRGLTHMNGAAIGDIDGDEQMDMVVLSYTTGLIHGTDSLYLNVYELNLPFDTARVAWGTYKRTNDRKGVAKAGLLSARTRPAPPGFQMTLGPNPAATHSTLKIDVDDGLQLTAELYDAGGRRRQTLLRKSWPPGAQVVDLELTGLPAGVYWVVVRSGQYAPVVRRLVIVE